MRFNNRSADRKPNTQSVVFSRFERLKKGNTGWNTGAGVRYIDLDHVVYFECGNHDTIVVDDAIVRAANCVKAIAQ